MLTRVSSAANPIQTMEFRLTWRPYQERVLQAVKEHLSDRRIHVVAAPGAGKTTLGLEVFRLIGQPALVLAPSRTIRDQWISRLSDFLPDGEPLPAWAGISLQQRTFFTAITYQALHTQFREEREEDDDSDEIPEEAETAPTEFELNEVIAHCVGVGVGTVILDEAHHLRQEWWRALCKLTKAIGDPLLVCLTATPPYDVVSLQWRRYEELCGPIDEEISVPELVRAGTLCPHQDYIWTCPPSAKDAVTARQHDQAVAAFTSELTVDGVLLDAIRMHSWVASDQPEPEAVLDDPEFAVASLVFLKLRGIESPAPLLTLLDSESDELPTMDRRWWSALLKRYLFAEDWPAVYQQHRENLARQMRQLGLLYRRELRLVNHAGLQAALAQSTAKIESCLTVHRLERKVRGSSLRQVILTDFIRDGEPDRLGAWPVFSRIVRSADATEAPGIALITGRLAIVHDDLAAELRSAVPGLNTTADAEFRGFTRIARGGRVVEFLTKCLGSGRIDTLVGTRSLLGEGWDCPAVNSLVLASWVGSFMTTNQMRGRAIRVDRSDPHKAASIWHLVAIDPTTPTGMCDLVQLEQRFDSFAGLHASRPVIETGLKRLMMGELSNPGHLQLWNIESSRRAEDFANLESRWKTAVEQGIEHRVVAAVDSRTPPKLRSFVYANTLRYLLYSAASGFAMGAETIIRGIRPGQVPDRERLYVTLALAGLVGLCFSLPKLLKFAWVTVRHLPADGSIRQIGRAVVDALLDVGMIKSPRQRLELRCDEIEPGRFSLALVGGSFYESSLVADSMEALLGPIENPRYIISRAATAPWHFNRRDYHALPPVLAAKKEWVERFHYHWGRRVGPGELIYTRIPEGRKALLRARVRALSTAFADPVRRRDRWC